MRQATNPIIDAPTQESELILKGVPDHNPFDLSVGGEYRDEIYSLYVVW